MNKLLLVAFGMLFAAAVVTAQPGHNMPGAKGIAKHLNLTPDQEKKFNDLRAQHQKDMVDLKANVQKNRIELKRMIDDGKIDEAKLLQLTDANSKLQSDMKHMTTTHWLDVYKMLNDEQKTKWVKGLSMLTDRMKMRARFRNGAGNFMGHRRDGRAGDMKRPDMDDKGKGMEHKEKDSK